ncbi:alpha/beta fold hydrolase [Zobellella iuensis]|uniref:Alpha/beta hydrolase n=1 Tax=Zobellella iuensis TaxID=2803811 RepID=A0ABS1QT05_9GAMM|nr:alpha/beta hydrolase [Zobellella iuensis]MBL1377596.1 alpha/beta hydrolase [Zobellella iuensis]
MTQPVLARHHVQLSGQGKTPLIFAHGFGCDQQIWHRVIPAFEADYRIVLFDHVGCGRSELSAYDAGRHGSLEGYARDLLELCDALGLEQATLVAHSVAGAIGMLAAIDQPERFRQLIAIGPSPCYVNDGDYKGGFEPADIRALLDMMERNHVEWAGHLAPLVMDNPHRPELAEDLRQRFAAAEPAISRRFAEVTFMSDIRARLPRVTVPTSILYCDTDAVVPLSAIEYLGRHLPRCRLHRLPASGHYPHLSHPDAVIAALRQELAAV